jgi:hypothetical protein
MKNSNKDDKGSRTPYEPPRLLDLGGRLAYAQAACKAGGSPGMSTCTNGTTAMGGKCGVGGAAAGQCGAGAAAAGGSCKAGSTATFSCKAGTDPM